MLQSRGLRTGRGVALTGGLGADPAPGLTPPPAGGPVAHPQPGSFVCSLDFHQFDTNEHGLGSFKQHHRPGRDGWQTPAASCPLPTPCRCSKAPWRGW